VGSGTHAVSKRTREDFQREKFNHKRRNQTEDEEREVLRRVSGKEPSETFQKGRKGYGGDI